MSNTNDHKSDVDDNELNSVVDEFFSFIYNEPGSDEEMGDSRKRRTDDVEEYGCSLTPHDNYVDEVLNKHFSFLNDEPSLDETADEFYSLDVHPTIKSTIDSKAATISSNGPFQYVGQDAEPIYSNISTLLSVRPKSRNEEALPQRDSLYLSHKEEAEIIAPQISELPSDINVSPSDINVSPSDLNVPERKTRDKIVRQEFSKEQGECKATPLQVNSTPEPANRITENIYRIGNNALIKISDQNDRRQEDIIEGTNSERDFPIKLCHEIHSAELPGKSSVYINPVEARDWKKRQRNGPDTEPSSAYTIRFKSDGQEPLVYALCTKADPFHALQTESFISPERHRKIAPKIPPNDIRQKIVSTERSNSFTAQFPSEPSKRRRAPPVPRGADIIRNEETQQIKQKTSSNNEQQQSVTDNYYGLMNEDQFLIDASEEDHLKKYDLICNDIWERNMPVTRLDERRTQGFEPSPNCGVDDANDLPVKSVSCHPMIEDAKGISSGEPKPSFSSASFCGSSKQSERNQFLSFSEEETNAIKSENLEEASQHRDDPCFPPSNASEHKQQAGENSCVESINKEISHCSSERDFEKLLSLDLELRRLEGTGVLLNIEMDQSDALFSGDNIIAEAFNTEVIPTEKPEVPLQSNNLPTHVHKPCLKSSPTVSSNSEDEFSNRVPLTENISSSSELTDKEISSVMRKSLIRQSSINYDNNELFLQGASGDDVERLPSSRNSFTSDEAANRAANVGVENSRALNSSSGENPMDRTLGPTLSGVLRRSMKRMKHIRLSGRRSKNRQKDSSCSDHCYATQNVSEETEVRRRLPTVPQMGLSSVRSPTASAVLLPSILAALTPNEPPREMLPSPEEVMDQPRSHARGNTADCLNAHVTHHRSCGTSHVPGSTRPPRTDRTPSRGSELNSPSSEVVPQSPLSDDPSSRHSGSVDPPTGINPNRIILGNGMSPVQVPILRLPANGTPVPVHGRNGPNLVLSNNNPRRHNNRHSRDTRERHRIRQTDSTNNARNQSNNNNNNNNNNSNNNNNNNTPRRASRTPPRQSSSSHLSSDGDLRTNSQRVRVARQVTHSQGFRPPIRTLWPHGYSGLMASLPVTLNMFNISRFAVLGAAFGWQFPIQWFVISLVVALPLMAFHAAIGQAVGGSVIDMWVISPIFQGVGYALLFVEIVLGVYCCLPVAWLFTYFRDSFDMRHFRCISLADCATPANLTREINTYVTGFFSSHILQRSDNEASVMNSLGSLKFDLSFNIALTWVITFLALSRGTRSYGKICYIIYIIPLLCYFTVCFYMVYWANNGLDMKNFGSRFIDRQPWLAASREAFLVWGLHGAVIQQMASGHKKRHPVWRDTTILAIITVCGLCFASFFGMMCVSALESKGLIYRPSSFESEDTRPFVDVQILYKDPETISMERNSILGPPQYLRPEPVYDNFYVGVRVRDDYLMRISPRIDSYRSGYNCLRFMTELFPALLFSKNGEIMSAWAPLFFLALLLFGLAQQLAVWHTVVQGVLRLNYRKLVAWETFITFCCCLFGFSAALPMASGAGIHIIYFLDYAIGSVWWIMILQLIMVFAVLFVRGKPYSAKDVAYKLFGEGSCCSTPWTVTPIAFFWTIIVPVGLLILSISSFKNGNYREVFTWASVYWSTLTCQIASTFQLFPLLLVPLVGLIQTCKYLADPRQDLFERIQHLYRPPLHDVEEDPVFSSSSDEYDPMQLPYTGTQSAVNEPASPRPYSDPPPKYTPPPSYSIATGSGFSKLFNRSFRTWRNTLQNQSTASADRLDAPSIPLPSTNTPTEPFIPPPDYSHQLHAYENPAIISDSSTSFSSPPQYATLDPLRMRRAFDAFRKGKSSLNSNDIRRQRNEICRFCGFAQYYEFRSRRNSAGDVPNEANLTDVERFQPIEFSEVETRSVETEDSDYVASIKHSCDTSSEYVDAAESGCSSRSIPGNDVTFTSRFNARYHPGEELSDDQCAEVSRRLSEQCTNPNCPGPSIPRHVMNNLSRIASYPNSFKRSTSLRRSWTSSLRRSARRLAAAISGTNSVRNRHCDGAILVSHVSNGNLVVAPSRSLSNLNIFTQSEA